jgi:Dna[CI] antecedent, DciA
MDRIGGQIDRELARSGSRDAIPLAAITAAWPAAVGAAVARQAWPLRLGRDGTLHVAVASSTWAHELDLLQDAILDGLRARLAEATPPAVRFAVGPIPEPPKPIEDTATENDPRVAVPPEIESEAAAAASEIDDPELRELVARAARASLVRARSDREF